MKRAVFVNARDDLSLEELTLFASLGYDTVMAKIVRASESRPSLY